MIDLNNMDTWPEARSLWQHHNGNVYRVICYTNIETTKQDTYPTTIVYENVNNFKLYSRKLIDWERSMKLVGE